MSKEELKVVADAMGCICDFSPSDDYMSEHCSEWCEEHCGNVEDWECWKKYIQTKLNEAHPKVSMRLNKCTKCNKRPELWIGYGFYEVRCPGCGKSITAKTEKDVRLKWNEVIK